MPAGEAEVDLEALEVRFDGRVVPFEHRRETEHRLLNGLDDIALTLQRADDDRRLRARRASAYGPGHDAAAREPHADRHAARGRHRPRDPAPPRRRARRRRRPSTYAEHLFGGAAIDAHGDAAARRDARCGAGPRTPSCSAPSAARSGTPDAAPRPEQGLLGIRKELGLFANLRPVRAIPALAGACPLQATSRASTCSSSASSPAASTSATRTRAPSDALGPLRLHRARRSSASPASRSAAARSRSRSVDKANVLATSRLWRSVGHRAARRGVPRHRARAPARRQRRDAARHQPARLRRDRHREHVRRHPHRRGVDAHRLDRAAAVGARWARRRPGPLRAGPRLRARHRRPGHRQPARDDPVARR